MSQEKEFGNFDFPKKRFKDKCMDFYHIIKDDDEVLEIEAENAYLAFKESGLASAKKIIRQANQFKQVFDKSLLEDVPEEGVQPEPAPTTELQAASEPEQPAAKEPAPAEVPAEAPAAEEVQANAPEPTPEPAQPTTTQAAEEMPQGDAELSEDDINKLLNG